MTTVPKAPLVPTVNSVRLAYSRESRDELPHADVLKLIWRGLMGLFRSRASLEVEILVLRHRVNVLRRRSPKRLAFSNWDRLIFHEAQVTATKMREAA
jgi:hypothetical protein